MSLFKGLVGTFYSHWVYRLLRWALAVVLVYAGTVKLLDPAGFAKVIAHYGLLPQALVPWAALGLPTLEVLTGLGLALEIKGSLTLAAALLVMFAAVLWWGVLAGLDIDCGCFSTKELAEHDALRKALMRDLVLLTGTAYLYSWRWECRGERAACAWRYLYPLNRNEVER